MEGLAGRAVPPSGRTALGRGCGPAPSTRTPAARIGETRNWPTTSAGTSITVPRKHTHHHSRAVRLWGVTRNPAVAGLLAALGVVPGARLCSRDLALDRGPRHRTQGTAGEGARRTRRRREMPIARVPEVIGLAKDSEGVALSTLAHLEFDRAGWCEEGRIHEGLRELRPHGGTRRGNGITREPRQPRRLAARPTGPPPSPREATAPRGLPPRRQAHGHGRPGVGGISGIRR